MAIWRAIAGGLVKQGGYRIHIANRGAEKRERLAKELNVEVSESLPELHSDDVLILAVKPQDMEAACHNVRVNGALVLSVAAGLSIDTLSRYLGGTRRIVRTMPNTPGKIGLGVSGMFAEAEVSEADRAAAIRYAVERAASSDIILIAGKGHENYQDVQGVKHHFSDFEIAEKALTELR